MGLFLVGLALFPVLLLAGMWFADEAAYREARAAGVPLELEDLYDTPMPADEDNAAVGILEAGELLVRPKHKGDIYRVWAYLEGTPEQKQFAREKVAENAPALAKLQEAVSRPEFRTQADIENPTVPDLLQSRMRTFMDLLSARILIRARDGLIDKAISDAEVLVALLNLGTDKLPAGPPRALQELVSGCTSEAELTALRDVLADLQGPSVEEVVRHRAFMSISGMRNGPLMKQAFADSHFGYSPERVEAGQIARKGYAKDLRWRFEMARLIRWLTPAYQQKMSVEEMKAYFDGIAIAAEESPLDNALYNDSIAAIPDIHLHQISSNYLLACRAIYTALVDSKLHYQRHGDWPKSLADLPDDYIDPDNGKPLSFKRNPDGILIWSSGPDQTSNPRVSAMLTYEVKASLPPPPYPPLTNPAVPDPLE